MLGSGVCGLVLVTYVSYGTGCIGGGQCYIYVCDADVMDMYI